MLKLKPEGVRTSTDSFHQKPSVLSPGEVREKARTESPFSAATSVAQSGANTPVLPALEPNPAPEHIAAPLNLPAAQQTTINSVCASVVTELRQTVGWDIDINEDLRVHAIDRKTLKGLLQHDYHINAFQAFVLSRVLGVAYLPSMKEVVIVEEVTRSWHPEYLRHEIAKAVVRLSLGLYANREAARGNIEVLKFEDKIDQLYSADYRYRTGVRAMATFQAAHAHSVARKHQPTTHTAPIRQQLWGILVWFTMHSYYKIRDTGRRLADSFETVLASEHDRVNRVYAHGRVAELWHGGKGTVHIDCASSDTLHEITNDCAFLRNLNARKGAVVAQVNFGSTRAFYP